jgi:hypothetical protein
MVASMVASQQAMVGVDWACSLAVVRWASAVVVRPSAAARWAACP